MAEGARLESVYAGDRIGGSNPPLSANFRFTKIGLSWTFSALATSLRGTPSGLEGSSGLRSEVRQPRERLESQTHRTLKKVLMCLIPEEKDSQCGVPAYSPPQAGMPWEIFSLETCENLSLHS